MQLLRELVLFVSVLMISTISTAESNSQQKEKNDTCAEGCGSVTISGVRSVLGVRGIDGEKGNKGDSGIEGRNGSTGERGLRGFAGPRGPPGILRLGDCSNDSSGLMRYNRQVQLIEYCDGNKWLSLMPPVILGSSSQLPASSCRQISLQRKSSTNGIYWIRPSSTGSPFKVFCDVSEGWTLIMKIDGNQQNFNYDNELWSNKQTFQSNNLDLDDREAKLASYWTLPFTQLRLGMKVDGTIRWITFNYTASSLYSLIADGQYRRTSIGESIWRSLLPTSSLQLYCNMEGFNVRSNHAEFALKKAARARLGIIANEQKNCYSADSFLGFGTGYPNLKIRNIVGNYAHDSSPDNGAVNIKAFGYVMAR